jgi:NitT/TauT family transport system substrate-binding protein
MKMRKPCRNTLLILLLLVVFAAPVMAQQKVIMATAFQEAINTTTLKMAEILKQKGIQVELIEHSGGSKTTQAVIAGQVDFGMGGADEIMIAVSKGAPIQAFSPAPQPRINYVVVGSPALKSLKDMAGKRFGISGTAGFDYLLTRIALTQNGVDPEQVRWTQIGGSSARAQALAAGRIDAVTVFLPNWLDLKDKGDFNKLSNLSQEFPTLTQSVFIARTDWLRENKALARNIIQAMLEAQRGAYNNKREWVDGAMSFIKGRERSVLEETYDNFREMGMFAADGGLSRSGSIALMKLLVESGDLAGELPLEKWLNTEILGPVLKD